MRTDDAVAELLATPGGDPSECWTNLGSEHGNGYRTVRIGGKNQYLHRISYKHFKGPIPGGAVVDHACHNRDPACPGGDLCPHRACWNPARLESATNARNILRGVSPPARNARKSACPQGHEYNVEAGGTRRCPVCRYQRRVESGEISGRGRPAERTHCLHGHPFDEANTHHVYRPDGSLKQRVCRECNRQKLRAMRAATKGGGN